MNRHTKIGKRNLSLLGLVLLLLFTIAFFATACEPGGDIEFNNMHSKDVDIYFIAMKEDGSLGVPANQGSIPANGARKFAIVYVDRNIVYRIEAIDTSGKVVFSRDYKMADLEKIDWKIVIPPLEE